MNPAKKLLKSRTTSGLRSAIREVRKEWRLCCRHRSTLRRVPQFLRTRVPLKLNLGSGPNIKPGWLNIDLFDPGADLQLDLREPWPFPNDSVSYIYSEHVFEHFEFMHEVPHFLAESKRVLRPGGVFDVAVPDTEWPIRAYGNSEDRFWRLGPHTCYPAWCETHLDYINYHFRQAGEHKYAWDAETLARSLDRAGFTSISQREFDPALDTEYRRTGTLYMRGLKSS